jgi:hypothetical protein
MTRANLTSVISDIAAIMPRLGSYLSRYFYQPNHRTVGGGIGQIVMARS